MEHVIFSIGVRPINNIVDITNFILHELGQPLHAFDLSQVAGHKIIVKALPKGTKFTTLDEVERELHKEDLMICDGEKPMCIAGVFGGIHSGVSETTTSLGGQSQGRHSRLHLAALLLPARSCLEVRRRPRNINAQDRYVRSTEPTFGKRF